jgi:hypothetical protein
MDVHLGWHFNDQLEFSVVGQSLFQPYHIEFADSPAPDVGIKRSFYVRLTWNEHKR